MAVDKGSDLIDWIKDGSSTKHKRFKKKWNIYKFSEANLNKYFSSRDDQEKSIEELINKTSPLKLRLAQIELQNIINGDPATTFPIFSLIFPVLVILQKYYPLAIFPIVIAIILLATLAVAARVSVSIGYVAKLKVYIDLAIELQDQKNT